MIKRDTTKVIYSSRIVIHAGPALPCIEYK